MGQEFLEVLAELADAAGATVYVVGGYLRDRLLDREPIDLDLLVEGDPKAFLAALSKKAGIAPVLFTRKPPTTYRMAVDGWLVDLSACHRGAIMKALSRRDFTINAMAVPLARGGPIWDQPIDPLGGLDDLRKRTIRYTTPAALDDDPLRLLRAVRLSSLLRGFSLDPDLVDAIRQRAPSICTAHPARILGELELILSSNRAGVGLRMMHDLGLLFQVFPELRPLAGLTQNRWHSHDVLEHTLRAVEAADRLQTGDPPTGVLPPHDNNASEILKWSVLLHDTGKATTSSTDEAGEIHFHGHEWASAAIASQTLLALRLSRHRTERVVRLIQNHLRPTLLAAGDRVSEKALRRLVHTMKDDTTLLCLLALADRRMAGGQDAAQHLSRLEDLIRKVMHVLHTEGDRLIAPPPLVTGHDVMHILSITPGPRVGAVLRWLTRLQVDRTISHRDEAIALLRSLPPSRLPS